LRLARSFFMVLILVKHYVTGLSCDGGGLGAASPREIGGREVRAGKAEVFSRMEGTALKTQK
jgi:hypothetical protein